MLLLIVKIARSQLLLGIYSLFVLETVRIRGISSWGHVRIVIFLWTNCIHWWCITIRSEIVLPVLDIVLLMLLPRTKVVRDLLVFSLVIKISVVFSLSTFEVGTIFSNPPLYKAWSIFATTLKSTVGLFSNILLSLAPKILLKLPTISWTSFIMKTPILGRYRTTDEILKLSLLLYLLQLITCI